MILVTYYFGKALTEDQVTNRKLWVGVALGVNLIFLVYFKYAGFLCEALREAVPSLSGMIPNLTGIHLPIGISFFVFHAMSYLIDAYRRAVGPKPLGNLALYISLFPQQIAGPIVKYKDLAEALDRRTVNAGDLAVGAERFIIGLGKKLLIANQIAFYVDEIFVLPEEQLSWQLIGLGLVGYAVQIYFDFSGYSDMAIGIGRILGFRFIENFDHPYIAQSVQEFWRRWHISLSNWFRDYVYVPLGGNRNGQLRTCLNIMAVFFLTGLWHGASYNFIIWGLWYGVFLVAERLFLGKLLAAMHWSVRVCYLNLVVLIGWLLFRANDFGHACSLLKRLVTLEDNAAAQAHLLFLIDRNFWITLIVGILLCLPLRARLLDWAAKREFPSAFCLCYNVVLGVIFLLALVYVAAGTYNPFIYFRF